MSDSEGKRQYTFLEKLVIATLVINLVMIVTVVAGIIYAVTVVNSKVDEVNARVDNATEQIRSSIPSSDDILDGLR